MEKASKVVPFVHTEELIIELQKPLECPRCGSRIVVTKCLHWLRDLARHIEARMQYSPLTMAEALALIMESNCKKCGANPELESWMLRDRRIRRGYYDIAYPEECFHAECNPGCKLDVRRSNIKIPLRNDWPSQSFFFREGLKATAPRACPSCSKPTVEWNKTEEGPSAGQNSDWVEVTERGYLHCNSCGWRDRNCEIKVERKTEGIALTEDCYVTVTSKMNNYPKL